MLVISDAAAVGVAWTGCRANVYTCRVTQQHHSNGNRAKQHQSDGDGGKQHQSDGDGAQQHHNRSQATVSMMCAGA